MERPRMSDRQIDPNTPMTVTIPVRHMNVVFAAMTDHANTVMSIMQDMQRQCLAQSMHAPPSFQMNQHRANGEAAAMEE
jgi:hypothetical protein